MTKFNFDLERMMEAVASDCYQLPSDIKTFEEFDEWMKNISDKNRLQEELKEKDDE
jgi:hypothetical protein